MVLTNARVFTSDDDRPLASMVVIDDGRIIHVGDVDSWENVAGLPVHDLAGRTVMPGFVDAHTHPSMVSQSSWHVRLPWTDDVDELLRFIGQYVDAHPVAEAPFVFFEYYPSSTFRESAPTKELLDSVVSDRPVLCQDFSEHEHWVNSKMLELMGVTKATPDPVPGLEMFVRDQSGEPTGLLREMVYRHFIDAMYDRIGWAPPQDLSAERIKPFFDYMTEHGVTSVFEALLEDEQLLQSISELDDRGELFVFYEGALRFQDSCDLPSVLDRVKTLQAKYRGRHISINTVKLFLDGTNESGNSAVLTPMCSHAPNQLGDIGMDVDELEKCFRLCNAAGVDVHIHLVGDRAFRVACDAVDAAHQHLRAANEAWTIQVTLAHCELVDPSDMARPAELGILINWTPHWSGGYFGESARDHLGEERWNRMYRFNEMAAKGAIVTFGSDVVTAYELHRADPLFGMQVAATRVDPEYPLDPAIYRDSARPESDARISREMLLKGYTINAAKQLRLDDELESVTVGKVANLVVLSDDVLYVAAQDLGSVKVDAVVFEGTVVSGAL